MKISHVARACSEALGNPKTFLSAVTLIIIWALSGPLFHFSGTWQLLINTTTTIFTFLAMFLLQNSQNNDTKAVHLKLDELILKNEQASNLYMKAEKEDTQKLDVLDELHENGHPEDIDKHYQRYYNGDDADEY